MHPKSLGLFLTIALLVVVSGCRSYGGYGSEEVMYRQIVQMIDRFEEDLERARGQLTVLDGAVEGDSLLAEMVDRYALLVRGQEAILDENRRLAGELSAGSSYRSLRRVHGSILAAQRTLGVQREGLLRAFSAAADTAGTADPTTSVAGERPYALVPPYYARIENAQQATSVGGVLRQARRAPSAPSGDAVETETPADTAAIDADASDTTAIDTSAAN